MKIIHVANYNYLKDGQTYYAMDYKIHNGLAKNGHMVYPFSYRDVARSSNIFGSKKWGISKTNTRLIQSCENIHPDLVLLAHAELIEPTTLKAIKTKFPSVKIAMWFVDALFNAHNVENINSKLPYLDALFITTGGDDLKQFENGHTKVMYMPNMVDSSIEIHKNFEKENFENDFIFCGTDYKDSERFKFLSSLDSRLSHLHTKFYGCLGKPRIAGANYIDELGNSYMGLNYSRRNDIALYSSDRIAHLTGNGLLTFTPRIPSFETLYTEDEVVYFDDLDDLVEKVLYYNVHRDEGRKIAKNGWYKSCRDYQNGVLTQVFIDVLFGNNGV